MPRYTTSCRVDLRRLPSGELTVAITGAECADAGIRSRLAAVVQALTTPDERQSPGRNVQTPPVPDSPVE